MAKSSASALGSDSCLCCASLGNCFTQECDGKSWCWLSYVNACCPIAVNVDFEIVCCFCQSDSWSDDLFVVCCSLMYVRGVWASADLLMLVAVMPVPPLLLRSKCQVLCMSSTLVCWVTVEIHCVPLGWGIVHDLPIGVFSVHDPGAVAGLRFSMFASKFVVITAVGGVASEEGHGFFSCHFSRWSK